MIEETPVISNYKYKLSVKEDKRLYPRDAYRLYSWLISKLPSEYGDELHLDGEKPLSQYLYYDNGTKQLIWSLSLLSKEVNEVFAPILLDELNISLNPEKITGEKISSESYFTAQDFIAKSREQSISETIGVRINTTLSFKQCGNYVIYPTIDLMIHSIVQKWNQTFIDFPIEDEDAIEALKAGIYINGYSLHTNRFNLKGVGIPGCVGEVYIKSKLAAPMFELLKSLIRFAGFSGVGIKTTLGMGGIEIIGRTK